MIKFTLILITIFLLGCEDKNEVREIRTGKIWFDTTHFKIEYDSTGRMIVSLREPDSLQFLFEDYEGDSVWVRK